MKKMNKKGFTIVELVIVIAVIAILAGVMIPTFSDVVEKAQASKALQQVKNEYTNVLIDVLADGVVDATEQAGVTGDDGYTFYFDTNGDLSSVAYSDYTIEVSNGAIVGAKKTP